MFYSTFTALKQTGKKIDLYNQFSYLFVFIRILKGQLVEFFNYPFIKVTAIFFGMINVIHLRLFSKMRMNRLLVDIILFLKPKGHIHQPDHNRYFNQRPDYCCKCFP